MDGASLPRAGRSGAGGASFHQSVRVKMRSFADFDAKGIGREAFPSGPAEVDGMEFSPRSFGRVLHG